MGITAGRLMRLAVVRVNADNTGTVSIWVAKTATREWAIPALRTGPSAVSLSKRTSQGRTGGLYREPPGAKTSPARKGGAWVWPR